MKKIHFTKMQGIGNDYIYIDCFKEQVDNPAHLARLMSPRRHSVGSDGVILICPSDKADAKMRMFNTDGSEGKMCGNGVRCVAKYIYDTGIAKKAVVSIETLSGIKKITVHEQNGKAATLTVDMGKPILKPADIPVLFDGENMIDKAAEIGGNQVRLTAVSMGNPHAVVFCDEIETLTKPWAPNLKIIRFPGGQHRVYKGD